MLTSMQNDRFRIWQRLRISRIFLFLIILLYAKPLSSQERRIELVQAIQSGELPEIDINCIEQDNSGFLWIGTWKGLYRYDGRTVINFSQLMNNRIGRKISDLHLDKNGNLWIGTYSEGLYVYNPGNNQISTYKTINNTTTGNIISITNDKNNRILVVSYAGIFTYNLKSGQFEKENLVWKERGVTLRLTSAVMDATLNLWVGSDQGLLYYDTRSRKLVKTPHSSGDYIHHILELSNGILAVSSLKGTQLFQVVNHTLQPLSGVPLSSVLSAEKGESFTSLQMKSEPTLLWTALPNGLIITDISSGTLIARPVFLSPKHVRNFRVESIFEDRQGILWVGTSNGLFKYDRNHKPFNTRLFEGEGSEVITIASNGKNSVWVGTNGKGVSLVELGSKGEPVSNKQLVLNNALENNALKRDIFSITNGFGGDLWISTKGNGIVHVKKYSIGAQQVTGLSTELFNESNGLADNHVMTLYRDSKGLIWGGCWSNGLIYFSNDAGKFRRLQGNLAAELKKYPIVKIIESGPGCYILGTRGDGMIEIELNSTQDSIVRFERFQHNPSDSTSICNNFISDFGVMPNNTLWIATEDGISIHESDKKTFINIGIRDGLQNTVIQSITPYSDNEVWAATENGLCKIILNNGLPVQIRNYNHYDGLDVSFFNTGSSVNNGNGMLYMGGKEGVCYFNPLLITDSKSSPALIITQISLFNEALVTGQEYDGLQIMQKSPWNTASIKLKYFQNTLSFAFSGMDFSGPEKISYAYKMEGIDKNWIYTSEPECYYPRLRHGKYTLMVKCSNSDGIWSNEVTTLEIRILPPWWFSGWAYTLYFLIFLGLSYFAYRLITYRQRLRIRQLEQEQEIDMYDMRMRFYTNISHEFRTPLTLIMGLTGRLRIHDDPEKRTDFYNKIDRNAKILLRLITDLIDLSKIEKAEIRLRHEKIDPSEFFRQSCENFADLFSTKGVDLRFTNLVQTSRTISGDPVRLESIVYNLLSNAYKYTPKNGSVECSIETVQRRIQLKPYHQFGFLAGEMRQFLVFRVKDTGDGMNRSELRSLFNKYQIGNLPLSQESNSISYGIGLQFTKSLVELHGGLIEVESEKTKGTTVSVFLPCPEQVQPELSANQDPQSILIKASGPESVRMNEKINRKGDEKIILVIDDNQEVRSLLTDILAPEYTVIEATDGTEGWEKAGEIVPDLIISDILMPGLDGNQLCEKIKTSTLTNHIPVILLTALPTTADRIKGLRHGADSYITKPFEAEHLLVRVDKLISSRNLLKEKYMKDFLVKPERNQVVEVNPSAEYISKVKKLIEQHIAEPEYDVADLCRDLGTSRMQLYRKLKATVGYSANELIRKIRLHKAADMLLRGDLNIAQVTYEVGFSDLQYFRMCFKEEFELTPSQYIRANSRENNLSDLKIDPFEGD
jgi:signal transduction histidine kinase/ligand-binding sensor domain-containing protein/DNA-binding response OmpR family regulator